MNTRRPLPSLPLSRRRNAGHSAPEAAPDNHERPVVPLPHDVAEWMGMDHAMVAAAVAYARADGDS